MTQKIRFHAVEFFRKVRDEQAIALAGKSPAEIIAFFQEQNTSSAKRTKVARRQTAHP